MAHKPQFINHVTPRQTTVTTTDSTKTQMCHNAQGQGPQHVNKTIMPISRHLPTGDIDNTVANDRCVCPTKTTLSG